MTDERKPYSVEAAQEVPTPIQEALKKHRSYVEGGKTDRVLLTQAISELIGYTPRGEIMTPIEKASLKHKRALLLCVEKDRGGDWTQASLGVFALQLEADHLYPTVSEKVKALVSDAVNVAQKGMSY